MKSITIIASLLLGVTSFAQNSLGEIVGTFKEKNGETIPEAYIFTMRGEQKFVTKTDMDGRFRLTAVPAGKYDVHCVNSDQDTTIMQGVDVVPDGIASCGDIVQAEATDIGTVYITAKVIDIYSSPVDKITAKDIKHMPSKFSTIDMIANTSSDVKKSDDGELVFRGARKGDVIMYLDGVKMTEIQNVPSASIGYVMVYSGAIPAKYGDTNGGVVVMETLSYFDLLREYESRK
jgi:hypothetical protein